MADDEPTAPDVDDGKEAPPGMKGSIRRAERVGQDPERVRKVVDEAGSKADKVKDRLGEAWHQLQTLFRLLRAWATGRYKPVPWRVIVISLAAVLYFLSPFDIIPDMLPGIGFLDDVGVLAYSMAMLRQDLDAFLEWERTTASAAGTPT